MLLSASQNGSTEGGRELGVNSCAPDISEAADEVELVEPVPRWDIFDWKLVAFVLDLEW